MVLSPTVTIFRYLVVPRELVDAVRTAKRLTDRHSPALEQSALADFMQSGAYERHVRKLRRKNAERRAALLNALAERFGNTIEVQGSEAGLHLVVWFNSFEAAQEVDMARRVREMGVGIYPISGLYGDGRDVGPIRRAGFVFGYAALDEREIGLGIERLARALQPRWCWPELARSCGEKRSVCGPTLSRRCTISARRATGANKCTLMPGDAVMSLDQFDD